MRVGERRGAEGLRELRTEGLRAMAALLHRAANDGKDILPLLDRGVEPTAADGEGRQALHFAAMNGHTLTLIALAAYGANLDARTNNGRTALHGACWNGHTQTALQLIEMGADPHAKSKDGSTPLMDASRNGHYETVIAMVTIVGADVRTSDINGRSALHYAALNGLSGMVKNLVDMSADVEASDNDGCRPLHFASWNGHKDTVRVLLMQGADPSSVDDNSSTPLHDAALSGRTSPAALLLDSKANIEARNNRGSTPLHSAASSGHIETTKLLLDFKADVNAMNSDGRTALHFATWNCHPRPVLLLLEYGADVNLPGEDGTSLSAGICHPDFDWPVDLLPVLHSLRLPDTPMHTAATKGDSRRVTSLAGYGVDVNCQDQVGDTPMHRAVRHRRMHTSKKLVELGADIARVNDNGVSVGSDMMMHFDTAQRETIQRKLLEREEQRLRLDQNEATVAWGGKSSSWSEAEEEDLSYMQKTSPIPLMSMLTNPGDDSTRQKRPLHFKPETAGQNSVPSPVLAGIEDAGATRAKKSSRISQRSPTPVRVPPSTTTRPVVKHAVGVRRGQASAGSAMSSSSSSARISNVNERNVPSTSGSQSPELSHARLETNLPLRTSPTSTPSSFGGAPSPKKFSSSTKPWSTSAFSDGLASPADELPSTPATHHPESEEENAKNPGDPSDCNPDDAHNLSTRPDQWAAHPVRLVCMQVDAWVSTLPGVSVWQTSKHVGPLQAMLRKPSDLSENIAWRVGEARAMRERWMRGVHHNVKLLGTVTSDIVHGDYKNLSETMQSVPVSQKMRPWVTRHATRWAMRVNLLRQTARSASVVVSELVRGKPGNVQNVIREQADVIAQAYKVSRQNTVELPIVPATTA